MKGKMKPRTWYAILYPNWNFNDTDELVRMWGTASVHAFPSRRQRDYFVENDSRAMTISAVRAKKIGVYVE